MAKFVQSATTLEVKDIKASEAFYREKLGFRPGLFFGEPPTFCIISRDDVTIFLDLGRTPHPATHEPPDADYGDDVDRAAHRRSLRHRQRPDVSAPPYPAST